MWHSSLALCHLPRGKMGPCMGGTLNPARSEPFPCPRPHQKRLGRFLGVQRGSAALEAQRRGGGCGHLDAHGGLRGAVERSCQHVPRPGSAGGAAGKAGEIAAGEEDCFTKVTSSSAPRRCASPAPILPPPRAAPHRAWGRGGISWPPASPPSQDIPSFVTWPGILHRGRRIPRAGRGGEGSGQPPAPALSSWLHRPRAMPGFFSLGEQ